MSLLFVLGSMPSSASAAVFSSDTIARAVRAFFPDAPHMVAIARCESGLRQYDASGSTLRGGWGGKMIGLFQLHETYHRSAARALGYDIDSLLGNILYAKTLYASEGTVPWNSSRHCWENATSDIRNNIEDTGKASAAGAADTPTHVATTLTKTLRYGTTDPEVRVLQRLLNKAGYRVTASGAETDYFGAATYKALVQFQCDRDIACLSKPGRRSGVGVVDRTTRNALAAS